VSGGFLRKVPVQGGTPQNIAAISNMLVRRGPTTGGLCSTSGRVACSRWKPLEAPTELTHRGERDVHQRPHALPGGRSILFASTQSGAASVIELVELATKARKRLLEGNNPHYLASGRLVFTRAGRLHSVPFDLARLQVTGTETPASDEIAPMLLGNEPGGPAGSERPEVGPRSGGRLGGPEIARAISRLSR
jgi:hypothetical protein